ncbi:polymorphic toxin type 30 domain-containing protein [Gloeothece verrucosa]|uniref:polymorphic toxin type 30 domain-containing protein n=1 Tax=Gloeothece verrucosa TaxID=2546359 RepID=UPI0002D8B26C|nr:polymorphic toxin type 30 domain-containing protein [Gloeothece verrucosa]
MLPFLDRLRYKDIFGGWEVGIDLTAPEGSNARQGWVVRIQWGNKFLDYKGNFTHRNSHNSNSPYYNPNIANDTHIPIQEPTGQL